MEDSSEGRSQRAARIYLRSKCRLGLSAAGVRPTRESSRRKRGAPLLRHSSEHDPGKPEEGMPGFLRENRSVRRWPTGATRQRNRHEQLFLA